MRQLGIISLPSCFIVLCLSSALNPLPLLCWLLTQTKFTIVSSLLPCLFHLHSGLVVYTATESFDVSFLNTLHNTVNICFNVCFLDSELLERRDCVVTLDAALSMVPDVCATWWMFSSVTLSIHNIHSALCCSLCFST